MGKKLAKRIERGELVSPLGHEPTLISEQWFSYRDYNGGGCCQTDHYLVYPTHIILLECKLTQTDTAILQMLELYVPVLEAIYEVPVIPVQVCKNMRFNPPDLIVDIEGLTSNPRRKVWTWHYLTER